jgi:hypothetical protein
MYDNSGPGGPRPEQRQRRSPPPACSPSRRSAVEPSSLAVSFANCCEIDRDRRAFAQDFCSFPADVRWHRRRSWLIPGGSRVVSPRPLRSSVATRALSLTTFARSLPMCTGIVADCGSIPEDLAPSPADHCDHRSRPSRGSPRSSLVPRRCTPPSSAIVARCPRISHRLSPTGVIIGLDRSMVAQGGREIGHGVRSVRGRRADNGGRRAEVALDASAIR